MLSLPLDPLKLPLLRVSEYFLLLPGGEEEQLNSWPTITILEGKLHHCHLLPKGVGRKVALCSAWLTFPDRGIGALLPTYICLERYGGR